jgi:hypothetical protein
MHQSMFLVTGKESVPRKVLLLGPKVQPLAPSSVGIVQVSSIVSYLSRAVAEDFDLLALCLFTRVHQERNALVELCGVLGTNVHTRRKPLLAVLPERHRGLLQRLEKVGVKFVMILEAGGDDLHHRLATLALPLNISLRIERLLFEICPFIHHLPINSCREIKLCGAYRNRLVLGPHRLAQTCEVPAHLTCEYFQAQEKREPSSLGGHGQLPQ